MSHLYVTDIDYNSAKNEIYLSEVNGYIYVLNESNFLLDDTLKIPHSGLIYHGFKDFPSNLVLLEDSAVVVTFLGDLYLLDLKTRDFQKYYKSLNNP